VSGVSNDTQALLTGMLAGFLYMEAGKYRDGKGVIKITDARPVMDDDGNYTNTITVDFESGTQLTVTVNEVTEIQEQE